MRIYLRCIEIIDFDEQIEAQGNIERSLQEMIPVEYSHKNYNHTK